MNDELLLILRSARRKLLAVRAAESACATVAVGAVLAAAGELAWAVAAWRQWVGVAIAFAIAAFGFALLLAQLRSNEVARQFRRSFVALAFASIGVFTIRCILDGSYLTMPKSAVAVVGVSMAALTGALVALAFRPDLRQVAAMLDAKAALRERLSTAVEMALSAASAPVSAPVVREQALAALRDRRPQDLPMWSATASLPAATALGLALCLAAAFLPDFGAPRHLSPIEQFSRSVPGLTDAQRAQLAAAFREAASRAKADPAAAREWAKVIALVEVKDAKELQQVLQRLQDANFAPLGAVPPELLKAAGLTSQTPTTMLAGNSSGSGDHTAATGEANGPLKPPGGYVAVFNPNYTLYAHPGESEANRPLVVPPATVPYADAWSAARARAMDNAQRGAVPPAYRRLVYDFFSRNE